VNHGDCLLQSGQVVNIVTVWCCSKRST